MGRIARPKLIVDGIECRECYVCHRVLPRTDFYGRRYKCRDCMTKSIAEYRHRKAQEKLDTKTKVCLGCGQELPITDFYRHRYGWYNYCKRCKANQVEKTAIRRMKEHKAEVERIANDPDYTPCKACKSWSASNALSNRATGWCMSLRKTTKSTFTCDRFRPNIKQKFVL